MEKKSKFPERSSRAPKSDRLDLLAKHLLKCERDFIVARLAEHDGNVSATATAIGLTRRGLERRIVVHGLRDFAGSMRERAGIKGPR